MNTIQKVLEICKYIKWTNLSQEEFKKLEEGEEDE